MAVRTDQAIPNWVHITQAAYNDVTFAKQLSLPAGSTVIMDRGYRDYTMFNDWTQTGIRWVTRMHPRTYFKKLRSQPVAENQKKLGVQRDENLQLGFPIKKIAKVTVRRIWFKDPETKKRFQFMTNDFHSSPAFIAQLYKKRWGIELLFKRLKQNMPLQYFLGDNQNAIKIQIWCALIADLLIQVVQRQVKRRWAFSNIVSLVRLHLFNYLNLYSFLENPETALIYSRRPDQQLKFNLSG